MKKSTLFSDIKKLGWSAIQLSQKGYRGAIKVYKADNGDKIPVMFYIDECFVVEDNQGLFTAEDLKDFFFKHKEVDLEATGCIEGLSLVAYIEDDGNVVFMEKILNRLNINNCENRDDLSERLKVVHQLGETVDVDLGY